MWLVIKEENHYGILSKNYNPTHIPTYSIYELFKEYYQNTSWGLKEKNLENVKKIVKWFCNKEKAPYTSELDTYFTNQLIIQFLFGNRDTAFQNMEILKNTKIYPSPFYDFQYYGEVKIKNNFYYEYALQGIEINTEKKIPTKMTLKTFLEQGKRKDIELFKEYLSLSKELNLNAYLKEIKEKTKVNVPIDIAFHLKWEVQENLKRVEQIRKKILN